MLESFRRWREMLNSKDEMILPEITPSLPSHQIIFKSHEECRCCFTSLQSTALQPSNIYQIEKCGHIFHQACLDGWTSFSTKCPTCQKNYPRVNLFTNSGIFLGSYTTKIDDPVDDYYLGCKLVETNAGEIMEYRYD